MKRGVTDYLAIILWTHIVRLKSGVTGNLAIILWTHIARLYNEEGCDW